MTRALFLLVLVGCAGHLSPEEREYRDVENAEKWIRCQEIYRAAGRPTVSKHSHRKGERHQAWKVREDLMSNGCESLLKRAGLD